ncbi:MAG: SDR family oxidoreductase [Sphingomonas sp.]|uniref:SDR family NAD(P)-dependent oxidoreductase n=1 Tax=Sphingomonas sp. TaxID=28214 RepID=UPI001AC69491|nr:SDR family NAD(P)-dependent oxidoreductase [Sphingomonas sp.]MBN8808056.1 SDR family oxidoreductase [Sphingomonas sp.]
MADPTILIVGASRGLGLAIATEFAHRGWHVIGTVRGDARTELHALADTHPGRIEIERLDINAPDQLAALRERLHGRAIDILFVNAGIATRAPFAAIEAVDADEFARVMLTNAYSPMRVVAALSDLLPGDGLIGVMSSGQGSIADNKGGNDVYRASKAALNMLMQSYAVRPEQSARALLLLAPGWIRTDLGGDKAPYTVEDSAPILADLLVGQRGKPGLAYLDRFGKTVPW